MDNYEILILILSAFLTSSISAVIGMGGGIILLGIMAIIIPEGYKVIALHGMVQLFSNTTRAYVFKKHIKKNTNQPIFDWGINRSHNICMYYFNTYCVL